MFEDSVAELPLGLLNSDQLYEYVLEVAVPHEPGVTLGTCNAIASPL